MARYDPAYLRAGVRKGGERGLWVYIPAEELAKTRLGADGPPPFYKLQGREGGATVVVELFRTRERPAK